MSDLNFNLIENQLNQFVEEWLNNATMIKTAIEEKRYHEIQQYINNKDFIIAKVEVLLKQLPQDTSQKIKNSAKVASLKALELENISNLEAVKKDYATELNRISKESKIFNAYTDIEMQSGGILDFEENEYEYD